MQNLSWGFTGLPHSGQTEGSFAPQFLQNLADEGFS
jgi:hypothetical protein